MNTWIPLWTSTLESTLWEEPPHVRVVFLTLLMMRDPDHVVRVPMRVLSKKANLDDDKDRAYDMTVEAIKILESEDRRSRDYQKDGGRRIRKTADGWLVVNGEKYDDEMRVLTARLRKTKKQRERRAAARAEKNGEPLPGEAEFVVKHGDGASERELDRTVTKNLPAEAKEAAPAEVLEEEGGSDVPGLNYGEGPE